MAILLLRPIHNTASNTTAYSIVFNIMFWVTSVFCNRHSIKEAIENMCLNVSSVFN